MRTVILSDHLTCLSLIDLDVERSAAALTDDLGRFGPVTTQPILDWSGFKAFIVPLETFPTRTVVFPFGSWSGLVESAPQSFVNVTPLSTKTAARAVSVHWSDTARQFHLVRNGKTERAIICQEEEDGRWVFHQEGTPTEFEDTARYSNRRIRERFTPKQAGQLVRFITGSPFPPSWEGLDWGRAVGIVRSTKEFRVPIIPYVTVVDA